MNASYFESIIVIFEEKSPLLGGELIYPKLPKTKETQCYQTFSGAVLYIKAGENFEFGER